jgi:anti-anti-sigma factor
MGERMFAIERDAQGAVVASGRLDAAEAPKAQAFLDGVSGIVTLDLAALDYVSSAGLGVLLKTQKRLMASGGRLRLVGLSPHLRDIFVYSGFDRLFEIVPAG